MRQKIIWIFIIGLALSACGMQAPPTPPRVENAEDLVEVLKKGGADIQPAGKTREALQGVKPESFIINGNHLWVYEFLDSSISEQFADRISGTEDEAGRDAAWQADDYRYWAHGNLLVIYEGTDGGTILLISGFIGDPISNPEVFVDEPYPPGIPAAIQFLSQKLGVDPQGVEVMSFTETIFPNSCLGFPQPDELCAEAETPGWVVYFIVDGADYEIHTDMLGIEVRWEGD